MNCTCPLGPQVIRPWGHWRTCAAYAPREEEPVTVTWEEFVALARHRVGIRESVGLPPRDVDAYIVAEPHEHTDARCCPYAAHGHHTMPHKGCILR